MPRRSWLMLYWLLLSACVSIGNADLASEQTMTNIQVGQTSRERKLPAIVDSQKENFLAQCATQARRFPCASRSSPKRRLCPS